MIIIIKVTYFQYSLTLSIRTHLQAAHLSVSLKLQFFCLQHPNLLHSRGTKKPFQIIISPTCISDCHIKYMYFRRNNIVKVQNTEIDADILHVVIILKERYYQFNNYKMQIVYQNDSLLSPSL